MVWFCELLPFPSIYYPVPVCKGKIWLNLGSVSLSRRTGGMGTPSNYPLLMTNASLYLGGSFSFRDQMCTAENTKRWKWPGIAFCFRRAALRVAFPTLWTPSDFLHAGGTLRYSALLAKWYIKKNSSHPSVKGRGWGGARLNCSWIPPAPGKNQKFGGGIYPHKEACFLWSF